MEKDELQLNPNAESDLKLSNTNIGVDNSDNDFVDMDKLALDAPLQFMAKYNSPREWILDEREAAKARIAFAPEDLSTREGVVGKVAYGLGGVGYETSRIIPETAQFVLSAPVAIEKTFFPNATETALDRIYNAINEENQKHRSEREEVVSAFTADSPITTWTQAFAGAAMYMIPVVNSAKIASKGVKAVAEARKIPAARIGMVTEKAAEKAAGRAIVGTSLAYGLGSSSVESAKQYMESTGASDLSGYNPALDTAVNTVANIVNANIEKSLGFDALVPHLYGSRNALLKGFTENLAKGFVGEFSEEGFQDAVSQIGEMVRGYRELWDFDLNRMAQNAIVGGIVGGTMGGGLYYMNRRAMIRKLEDSGMSHELATDITDSVLTDGIEKTMNNLSAQMELNTQKGQAYEKLKAGIKNALLVQGWNENMIDPMTNKPMNIDEYVELLANNEIARRAIREALQSGISVDEFLDVAQFTAIDNFMIVKPLGTAEQIKARIDEQSAIIKRQQELKKTGAGDSKLLSEAKMKKAILQKAYVNAKVNQEIQKVSVEEAKTPEIKKEIATATQDADNLTKTDTVADFNENLDNKTQDGQPITTSQKIKRFGNAVIKKIFGTDKQGFDTVMTLPQYANARNAMVSSADRIFEFAKKHRTYGIYKDLRNALKLMQTVNADNFVEMVKSPDLTGNDVVAQNAFLYHFIFSDANTTSAFINAYLERAEASITNETGTSLSKKDLVQQAFQATDNLMSTQAQTAGIQYTSIYNEDGSLADENVAAVVMSYQNQFAVDVDRITLYQPEQFDLADENARLDDIYPAYDGKTIEVDGKERSVYNSNGERIAQSEPALRNFYKWFGNSKVVDSQGRPLVVYHGTKAEFDTFEKDRIGDFGKGYYFTTSRENAEQYAARKGGDIVMPVYLSVKNVYEAPGNAGQFLYNLRDKKTSAKQAQGVLLEQGFDGIEIKQFSGKEKYYVAFEPTQIKSVDNRGTYSEDTGNILYQTDNPTMIEPEDIIAEQDVDSVIQLFENNENPWGTLIDPVKYKAALEDFVKNGQLLRTSTSDVESWFEIIVRNTAILEKTTELSGHTGFFPFEEVKDYYFADEESYNDFLKENNIDPNASDYEIGSAILEKKGFYKNMVLPDGSDAISDYGLSPLWNIIQEYKPMMSAEDVLVLINRALDIYHQRGDLASAFIKGGAEVATAISNDFPLKTAYYQGRQANGFYDPELSVILLGKNWNTMTLPHELAHYWLDTLFNIYKRVQSGELQANQEWINEKKEMFAMLGIDENQTKLTKGQQEKFAAMTEAYLTGIGVSKDVPQTFKDYFKWVPEKYKSLQQLAYLDENNKVQNVFLDAKAVEFFNRWYGNPTLPSLSTSPERQRYMNITGDDGEVQKVSIKEMNDREKEFAQDAEEQVHTDERLYNTLDENMPADIKPVADAQKVVIAERGNFLKDSEEQQRRWYERKSRDTEAQLAQEYIEKNPEHAKEVIFGYPEFVPNDTGVDRATLINAYMALNNITPDKPEWATLHTNIAINQSLAGTQLALGNDKSYGAYLDALREVENALEMKAATNYAGSKTGARERFNVDIQRFLDREMPSIFATEPNSKEREIALKTMFEKARTTFSGNTTGTFLNQMDMSFAMKQKGKTEAFVKWATNQIKKDAGAKLNSEQQAKLLEISAKAQQALVDLNNPDASKAIAAAQELRKWQVEKDKLMGVSEKKFSLFGFLFGEWAPRAMLASFNTLLVANPPSTALNTFFVNLAKRGELFGKNNVSKNLIDNEIARIKKIWKATGMNLAQMEKPTSPSLLHGEKYSTSGQKIYDPYTILGWEDNLFRVPTFVDTLARIASTDAKATGRNADDVFKEYLSLDNPSDAAKLARKQALAVANMAVFTQDGALAKCLNHIRSELNVLSRSLFGLDPKGFGLGNLIAPFLKTGANIAEMGIRGSLAPITTITTMVNSWRTGKELDPLKKLALRMDWTYFAFSSVALALLAALTSDDDEFYTDPYISGRKYDPDKPYDSINIGGVWVDLDFFGAFAIPMRTAAMAIRQWKKDNNIGSAVIGGYTGSAKNVIGDVPLVESIVNNQFSWAVKQPGTWAGSYTYTQLNKLVPAQIKPVSRAISRGAELEYEGAWLGKSVGRKFHRNYGFDGAELTSQDLIEILSIKFQLGKDAEQYLNDVLGL